MTLPNLAEGRERAGKSLDGFMISGPFFVVTGTTEEEFEQAMAATKQQIAFYGSTPAYAKVLELHGWDDLQPRLNTLSKQGDEGPIKVNLFITARFSLKNIFSFSMSFLGLHP